MAGTPEWQEASLVEREGDVCSAQTLDQHDWIHHKDRKTSTTQDLHQCPTL